MQRKPSIKTRIVNIPGTYDVNIRLIQQIVDHPFFQSLRHRRQMGTCSWVFPSANHTRFEHSLGTYSITRERTARWMDCGAITEEDAHNINLYGLLHDIGHGPYSHECEPLCLMDHNQHGCCLLNAMHKEIAAVGGDLKYISDLFLRKNSLAQAVSHPQLGTDKLDYLCRDTRHANAAIAFPMGSFIHYVHMLGDDMAIDAKILPEMQLLQSAYLYQYGRVYLTKTCLIVQRLLQKAIHAMMQHGDKPAVLNPEDLQTMVDSQLDALLFTSTNPTVRTLHDRLMHRRLPKTAISLRPTGLERHERRSGKPIAVFGVPWGTFESFESQVNKPANLSFLERIIAEIAGIDDKDVLVVPAISRRRFTPADILVQDFGRVIGKMSEMFPAHYASLAERTDAFVVIRICVPEEHRERIASPEMSRIILESMTRVISNPT